MIAEVYRTHSVVTGSMNFKKSGFFFPGKSYSRVFGGPGCHPGTLIDLVNVALDSGESVKTICMIWEGCGTHRVVTGPMNLKKNQDFCRKSALPGFWDPGFHPCTLNDLVNTAVARRDLAENICMISEGYKAHRGVTGPMNFKKIRTFFRKNVLPDFGAPGCHPSILIDFINTALAKKGSVKTKCMIEEVYRTHSVVTDPMNFKESGRFFRKIMLPGFGPSGCRPGTLIDLVNIALDSKVSVETIRLI